MDLWLELALIFGCGFIRLTYNMVLLLHGIAAPMGEFRVAGTHGRKQLHGMKNFLV